VKTKVKNKLGHTIRQILIADDDDDMVQMLTQRCSSLGCSVIGVNNALDALNVIHRVTPDLVCLDVSMPSGNGLSVCEMMASDPHLRSIPVIILTGQEDPRTIRRCHDLLVYYVCKSPDTWQRIEPLVRELLQLGESTDVAASARQLASERSVRPAPASTTDSPRKSCDLADAVFDALGVDATGHTTEPASQQAETAPPGTTPLDVPWILCIDDDADFTDALRIRLEEHGVAVARAFNGMAGYRLAFTQPASAILLDFNMPNGQGDYILSRLKDNPVTRSIPVVVISGARDKTLQRRLLAMAALAFFEKPVDFETLRNHLSQYVNILNLRKSSETTAARVKASAL
jgi:CheY-like chemotaxis protein